MATTLRGLQGLVLQRHSQLLQNSHYQHKILLMTSNSSIRCIHSSNVNKATKDGQKDSDILLVSTKNGVTTMTMNTPKKLNGWTGKMMMAVEKALHECARNPETKVAVLTGADPYYCAGVSFSDTMAPMMPRALHRAIKESNEKTFNNFIEFPKPILIAANGPAIGACVTSATLCDRIVASERATFSTPFARLGIPPEGCSSIHFYRIMSKIDADRMLHEEGWVPTAKEAKETGLIQEVVPHEQLLERAQQVGEQWIKEGKKRWMREDDKVEEYKAINARESEALATAFLSSKFLDGQYNFLKSKGKPGPARFFRIASATRPLWSKLL